MRSPLSNLLLTLSLSSLNDPIRDVLDRNKGHFSSLVTDATILVFAGVALEGIEYLYDFVAWCKRLIRCRREKTAIKDVGRIFPADNMKCKHSHSEHPVWVKLVAFGGLVCVVTGVLGEWQYGSDLEDANNAIHLYDLAKLTEADQKAGEANKRAEELKTENLKLEALIQPRELSVDQQKAIGDVLRRFSGKSVFLRTYSFDQESMRLSTLLNAALTSGGIDVQFAPTPSPLILPVGINVTGSDKAFVEGIKRALRGKLDLTDPNWKPAQVVGGVFVGAYSPKAISADIFVGAKPFSLVTTALTAAQQAGEYAAWRTISDEQAKIIRSQIGSSLTGHPLTVQANPNESEIWEYADRIVAVFGMRGTATLWPPGWTVPSGLRFSIGKNRQQDFDMIVKALDAAGVEDANALRKRSEHAHANDDDLILTVGPRH
jgi:hypothetical protein